MNMMLCYLAPAAQLCRSNSAGCPAARREAAPYQDHLTLQKAIPVSLHNALYPEQLLVARLSQPRPPSPSTLVSFSVPRIAFLEPASIMGAGYADMLSPYRVHTYIKFI
jgi:hypothetical protein